MDSLWHIEKVCGSDSRIRIKNAKSGEYLYAAADDLARDDERRRVFTWTNMSTIPDSDPGYWEKTADWIVSADTLGFTLKNVHYNEYLYAAADDLALADDKRSVFTWKHYDDLGNEGFWHFNTDILGKLSPSYLVLNWKLMWNILGGCWYYVQIESIFDHCELIVLHKP